MKKSAKDWFNDQKAEIGETIIDDFNSLINSGKFFHWSKDSKSDNGLNTYNLYGDYANDKIYMTIKVGDKIGYGRVNSGISYPKMIDRMFGIDVQDSDWAQKLADCLAYIYAENHTLEEWFESCDKINT